ncbi:MAG TPA: RsmE family RNA methyltransferase [Acidimicrobiales bacterium]
MTAADATASVHDTGMSRPPRWLPLVFVDDLAAPRLTDDDAHHLRRVLRVRDQDVVTLADGNGRWCAARLGAGLTPLVDGDVCIEPEPAPPITIAFALVKGDRPETIVQKLTELGVDRIVPFVAARSVVRWDDDKARRNVERLRKVAREAAMQCRRARLPVIDAVATFDELVREVPFALADFDGGEPSLDFPAIAIGPEGGWSDDERAQVPTRVVLSAHVLRTETAAMTAGALLASLRSATVRNGRYQETG